MGFPIIILGPAPNLLVAARLREKVFSNHPSPHPPPSPKVLGLADNLVRGACLFCAHKDPQKVLAVASPGLLQNKEGRLGRGGLGGGVGRGDIKTGNWSPISVSSPSSLNSSFSLYFPKFEKRSLSFFKRSSSILALKISHSVWSTIRDKKYIYLGNLSLLLLVLGKESGE